MKKLVFFDIDGTLIPENATEIPTHVVDAVKKIMNDGVYVFICTGRCYHQAKDIIEAIGTHNYICSNGQEVCFNDEILYMHTFNNEQKQEVIKLLEDYGVNWGFETRENLCIPDTKSADDTQKLLEGYNFNNLATNVSPDNKDIYQFWINGSGAKTEELLEILQKDYTYYRWEDDLYEILPGVENKAKGIDIVKNHINEECITYAFGDGVNDLEMMKNVDHSVCMGNGIEAVKQASEFVSTNSSDNGIINGLKMVGLYE